MAVVYVLTAHTRSLMEHDTDSTLIRNTPWSFAMQESVFGCSRERTVPRISQTEAAAPMRQHGEKRWQIFPANTVISAPISRIKVSSQISISVVTSRVLPHTIRTSIVAQIHEPNGRQRTEQPLQTLVGSSTVSRFIRRHDALPYYNKLIMWMMRWLSCSRWWN